MEWIFSGIGTAILSGVAGLLIGGVTGYEIGVHISIIRQNQQAKDNADQTQIGQINKYGN